MPDIWSSKYEELFSELHILHFFMQILPEQYKPSNQENIVDKKINQVKK